MKKSKQLSLGQEICISFILGWCTNYMYYLPRLVHNLDNLHVRGDSLDDHTGIQRCTHHAWFLLYLITITGQFQPPPCCTSGWLAE